MQSANEMSDFWLKKIEKITEEATDSDSDGETMGSVDI